MDDINARAAQIINNITDNYLFEFGKNLKNKEVNQLTANKITLYVFGLTNTGEDGPKELRIITAAGDFSYELQREGEVEKSLFSLYFGNVDPAKPHELTNLNILATVKQVFNEYEPSIITEVAALPPTDLKNDAVLVLPDLDNKKGEFGDHFPELSKLFNEIVNSKVNTVTGKNRDVNYGKKIIKDGDLIVNSLIPGNNLTKDQINKEFKGRIDSIQTGINSLKSEIKAIEKALKTELNESQRFILNERKSSEQERLMELNDSLAKTKSTKNEVLKSRKDTKVKLNINLQLKAVGLSAIEGVGEVKGQWNSFETLKERHKNVIKSLDDNSDLLDMTYQDTVFKWEKAMKEGKTLSELAEEQLNEIEETNQELITDSENRIVEMGEE